MELEELKKSWDKIGQQSQEFSNEKLKSLVENSSKSPLVKIRKNMIKDCVLFVIILLFIIAKAITKTYHHQSLLWLVLGSIFIMTCLSIWFYIRIHNNTKLTSISGTVKEHLKTSITNLSSDIRYLKIFNYWLIIPALLLGFTIYHSEISSLNDLFHPSSSLLLELLIIFIIFIPASYFFINFWAKRLYGKYLDELKEMFEEINEQ